MPQSWLVGVSRRTNEDIKRARRSVKYKMGLVYCPVCKSSNIWKDGVRSTTNGEVQRYICRACGFRFSENSLRASGECFDRSRIGVVYAYKAKNLAMSKQQIEGQVGVTKPLNDFNAKGKTVEFLWYLKKQGYAESTSETYYIIIRLLVKHGVNVEDPQEVKKFIATQKNWGNGRKQNVVNAYSMFLKTQGRTWEKPRYKAVSKLPFIPNENEIDSLIAGCSKQIATFLQVAKETGPRRGEIYGLRWFDIDFVSNTIRITPEKGINPRLLRISFHTLRYWKATIEYAKTKDILYVQRLLGHRNLKTTLRYTQLVQLPQDEKFICKVAKTVKEAKELVEAGFE